MTIDKIKPDKLLKRPGVAGDGQGRAVSYEEKENGTPRHS